MGASAAGSGLEEEDECCPAEGERSDYLERGGSSAIGERSESVIVYGHMSSSDLDTGAGD